MKFYEHGSISEDDLFTVAERANNILTRISGEMISLVSMYSTPAELIALQFKMAELAQQPSPTITTANMVLAKAGRQYHVIGTPNCCPPSPILPR